MSEDDFMVFKDNLIQPFNIYGRALCNVRVIETERSKYFLFGANHILCDGRSEWIFFHNLERLYLGKEIYHDIWPQFIVEQEAITEPQSYDEITE